MYSEITDSKYIIRGITSLQIDNMTVSPKLNQRFITNAVDEIKASEPVIIDIER